MTRIKNSKQLISFAFLVLFSCLAQAQRPEVARIDSFMTELVSHGQFNGSLLVAEKGQIIYQRSGGFADLRRRIQHTDTTHFNLASLSKPFTAVAALQLVQQKKLNIDDLFATYFSDFPYPTVTIRHLLAQTSGLPILERMEDDYIKDHPNEVLSNQQIYSHLLEQKKPLLSEPGNNWRYNNLNYVLLAMLVEKISKIPFAVYMKQYVFKPAGMQATYVREATMPNTIRYTRPASYFTQYHNVDSLDHRHYYTYYNLGSLAGPNNVVSTIQDLWKFDRAFFGGKLISPALVEAAMAPVQLNNGKAFRMGNSTRSYGLGWNVYDSKTEPVNHYAFHDGHIVGLTTFLNHNITKDQTIIYYDNMDHNPIQVMVSISNLMNGLAASPIQSKQSLVRIYGEALVAKGPDYAITKFNELKDDSTHYYVDELEMNRLGLELLQAASTTQQVLALEVLKLNTFPKSGNTYDSYAIALTQHNRKEEAIAMYRKSIAIWPTNEDGKKALQKLLEK